MAWSLISNVGGQSTTGNGFTSTAINTVGADLLVFAISSASVASNPSDSAGNTWLTAVTNTDAGTHEAALYYVFRPTTSASHTFTCSGTGSVPSIAVQAWSGSAGVLDQTNSANASSVTSIQPGSITPTQANELVVTGFLSNTATAGITVNSSYTISNSFNVSAGLAEGIGLAYLVQTTAAATNPTWSWTTAGSGIATIASFNGLTFIPSKRLVRTYSLPVLLRR